jgi:pimeloyl-ACP methyl ester carboxylesterase
MKALKMLIFLPGVLLLPVKDAQAGAKSTTGSFDAKGVKIAYAVQGQGEPVVLIHGWLSSGWINWDLPGITKLLSKDHQVIRIDVRGHGFSEHPAKEEAYGTELVEDVARLLDRLKIKKAHIVGYSMGGIITAKFLVKYPDRVLSGTLGGMGWLREGSFEQKFFEGGGKDGQPAGLCFRSLAKLALSEKEIKSIKTPVLVLFGDHDFLKKGYLEPLKTARPDWPVIEIPGADHITCVMQPRFREEISAWLAKQAQK